MEEHIDAPTRIEHPGECLSLLEGLCQPGGASLLFPAEPGQSHPVVLMELDPDEGLVIDVSAVPELAPRIERGEPFQLCGQVDGAMLRTPELSARQRLEGTPRLQYLCDYPAWLDLLHRRSSYRAELRDDMPVQAELRLQGVERALHGRLLNLSLGGCLLELPAVEAVRIEGPQELDSLELRFPGGQRLALSAQIRHLHSELDWQNVRFGCQFLAVSGDQERRLWLSVREIEREKARASHDSSRALRPSALFAQRTPLQLPTAGNPLPGSSIGRRLGRVAGYLDTQLIKLRQGAAIDSRQLSRHSELLLDLLAEDRDALLFAVQHQPDEPLLVQHGMALAARLADLAQARNLPRQATKAIVAAALVHDFGKALLSGELQRSRHLDAGQRQRFAAHVGLLRERLESCRWLAGPVVDAVVGAINERLDGSGYPHAAAAERLGELARMAAVTDVVDAMARPRADRPAQPIDAIYRHLLASGEQFDPQWSQRYIRHFGAIPVGSLVRFVGGQLAWVRRLDREGRIAQVQPTATSLFGPQAGAPLLADADLAALGRVDAVLVPGD
ncbi:PilZ domain-containing protein [Pseudomonas stutzeri]|nr:PilZ domain-containing protein [Stutzerimonas stutzeri]